MSCPSLWPSAVTYNVRPISGRHGRPRLFILQRRLTPWRSAALAGYAAARGELPHIPGTGPAWRGGRSRRCDTTHRLLGVPRGGAARRRRPATPPRRTRSPTTGRARGGRVEQDPRPAHRHPVEPEARVVL